MQLSSLALSNIDFHSPQNNLQYPELIEGGMEVPQNPDIAKISVNAPTPPLQSWHSGEFDNKSM